MKLRGYTAALFFLLPMLLGCTSPAQPSGEGPGTPSPITAPEEGGLRLSLTLDKASYRLGEPVAMTLTVTNGSREPFRDDLKTSQVYDFLVRKDGKEVWRWSGDKGFLQVITPFTLAPGQSVQYQETWDQTDNRGKPIVPGEYKFVAVLKILPERWSSTGTAQVR